MNHEAFRPLVSSLIRENRNALQRDARTSGIDRAMGSAFCRTVNRLRHAFPQADAADLTRRARNIVELAIKSI